MNTREMDRGLGDSLDVSHAGRAPSGGADHPTRDCFEATCLGGQRRGYWQDLPVKLRRPAIRSAIVMVFGAVTGQ